MSLLQTSFLSAISVVVRLASALAINKVLAIYVGPAGYALISQLQSVISIAAGVAGGAFSNGVIKSTAEHFDDEVRQQACWQTAMRVSLWSTVVVGATLLFARSHLSIWLFAREDYSDAIIWLVLALPAIGANSLFLAMLNGRKEIGAYAIATIVGNVLGFAVMASLAAILGTHGALIACTISPAISVLASATLLSSTSWFRIRHLWGPVSQSSLAELSKFALMMLTTAVCTPIAQILIRNLLGEQFGWTSAGHWQAICKISEIYLMFITLTLGTYYLPRVAEIRSPAELRSEIAKVYRFALPLAAGGAIVIFLGRDALVLLLFTADFAPMTALFPWQLAGDVCKIASWVLAYVLIGKVATFAYIATEILFSISLVVLTWLLTGALGLAGAPAAHFVNYVLYLGAMSLVVKRLLRSTRTFA